ncbi:MAG: hypothetical protein ACYCY5_01470 [Sulfuricella sp.]
MFIRTTPTRNTSTGETYTTHRLVESRRVGGKVRQVTLLNLGRHFPLPKERWPDLCSRIDQLLGAQASLVELAVPETVERLAQRYAAQLVVRASQPPVVAPGGEGASATVATPPAFAEVDPDSLQLVQPRSVGVEHVALSAMQALDFEPLLASLGINGVMRTSIIATNGMVERFAQGFETGLQKIADGLNKPHGEKRHDKLLVRIGRLKEKSRGASPHYTLNVETDESGKKVTALTWEKSLVAGTMATHPGVYCLRSSETGWDEETLWRTYTLLTDLESVFRSLKGELGLRPIFHSKEERSDGHLFISVPAYQFVQVIRTRLKAQGIHTSWAGLREVLAVQRRVTPTFVQRDGRTLHVRKSTQPEPDLKRFYEGLGVALLPGGTKKLVV